MLRYHIALAAVTVAICAGMSGHVIAARARAIGDLNPKAITITLPADIKWTKNAASERAVLYGDPSKPGYYAELVKWLPHNNSRPHYHQNDRFIQVLSGTWMVQTGAKYDPAGFKPIPAGSFVVHTGKEIHYDGAKDVPALLLISGMGPDTSVPAEEK
jgi:phenylpropionate dioxygenase-like ring-hydroxylating dioxygenase large terminal subunit